MNRAYYQEYYHLERNHWWFKTRGQIIMDRLAKEMDTRKTLKILNIGAATGRTSELLANLGEVTSVEYDAECCAFTRQETKLEVIQASILELPFEHEVFDLVCAFDVIEHVEDDQKAIAEMKRVCKPAGKICITVPAFMQLWSHHDVVNQHYRRYVMPQVTALLASGEGELCYRSYFNSLLFVPIWSFRRFSHWLGREEQREGAGSDFSVGKNSLLQKTLGQVFSLERKLLHWLRFPFGVSILAVWQK